MLTDGLPRLEEILDQAARGNRIVAGEQAFKLYDTYGLPRDFIEDLAAAQGLQFDAEGFERAMEGQREKARAKSAFDGGRKGDAFTFTSDAGRAALSSAADEFDGYTTTSIADDAGRRSVRRGPAAGRAAGSGIERLSRCWRERRSISRPAVRCRIAAA